jgi:hypothetical protein
MSLDRWTHKETKERERERDEGKGRKRKGLTEDQDNMVINRLNVV